MFEIYNNNLNKKKNIINIANKLTDFEDEFVLLGKGNFGTVEKRKSKIDNLFYAIKKLNKKNLDEKNFIREIEILKNINHPNLINFYGSFEDNYYYYLVFEYVENGSLKDYIDKYKLKIKHKEEITPFNEDFVIKIFKDILNGLKYLHSNNILHRDIKPDNILLDVNFTAKITDFGISAFYKNFSNIFNFNSENILYMNNTRIGDKNYISPEIIYGDKYDFKSDIFSLGITIFYLMNFNLPYYSKIDEFQNVERYFNGNIINQCYSIHLRNLVMKMLNSNPNNRPNSFQAYDELIMIEQNSQNNKLNQNFINFQNFQNNGFRHSP